jgi:hypothetical protein
MMAMMTTNMQAMFQAQQAAAAAAAMPTSSSGGSSGAAVMPQQQQQQQQGSQPPPQQQQQLQAAAGSSLQGQRSSSGAIPGQVPGQNMLPGMGSVGIKMDPAAGMGLSTSTLPASLAAGVALAPAAAATSLQQQHAGSCVGAAAAAVQQQQQHPSATAGMAAHDFSNMFSDVFDEGALQAVPQVQPAGHNTQQGLDEFLNLF